MNSKYTWLATAGFVKIWPKICNTYRNIEELNFAQENRKNLGTSGGSVLRELLPRGGPRCPCLLSICSSILDTFTFESDKLRVLCRIVCQNHYRSVADAVFENLCPASVFVVKIWHTSIFLDCMPCMPPTRPILNYPSYSESEFVCHVCQNQIM